MKAAVVTAPGMRPVYADFDEPVALDRCEIITVSASALSQLSKSRSVGAHYSSDAVFPCVAGVDGVGHTQQGRRVYFVRPDAPYGALAERSRVSSLQCLDVPPELDDVTAAAIANPGMSAWAALTMRAHLGRGERVLVNGATGTAGRLAVQLAKYLGAGAVIGTGRNTRELEELHRLGADTLIPLALGSGHPTGAEEFEEALIAEFARGIDVVIDYLWGESARTIIVAIAKAVEDGHPVRFVHVGGASREENVELPGAALRSSAIQLMGSGAKSIPFQKLLDAMERVFDAAVPAKLEIATKTAPLSAIAEMWDAPGKPRVVFRIR